MKLPYDQEAEEAVIAAIMVDSNNTIVDIASILRPEHFYSGKNKTTYDAIISLFNRNVPVDLVSVTDELRRTKNLDRIGGAHYLSYIIDRCPAAVDCKNTAMIVRDKAVLRILINKSHALIKLCSEEDYDSVDDVINYAEKSIYDISTERSSASKVYSTDDLIFSCIDQLEHRQRNKSSVTGVRSGFRMIDELTAGFQNSDLIILAARPSMGKTALALNIARNAAVMDGVPVMVSSLEMSKEQLVMRLFGAEARVNSGRMRTGAISNHDWDNLHRAAETLSAAPIYIDDKADISATEIRTKARQLKMDVGLGLIIVDYIQLMRVPKAERRDLEIGEISRSLKIIAKELDVPVIALSQLNRALEQRADKRPMLSDLRESGSLEQDADIVMFIYRDEVYNKDENNPNRGIAEIIIAKQRNGPTGVRSLLFLNSYTRFEDL